MSPFFRPSGPAIAQAAASGLNDDLTVIVSVLRKMLQDDEIEREFLLEAQSAAQRAIWTAAGLLNWASKNGARASAVTLERLLN